MAATVCSSLFSDAGMLSTPLTIGAASSLVDSNSLPGHKPTSCDIWLLLEFSRTLLTGCTATQCSQDARNKGMDRLVLLTTRTADWFMQRDFKHTGPAWCSDLLPAQRRAKINPARNSQLYVKQLVPLGGSKGYNEPGTRIGF